VRIIFINRFFYPDYSATSQILSDFAFALAEGGHNVAVLTSRLSYDGGRRLKPREQLHGVQIVRLPTTGFGRRSILGRAIDYISFYCAALISLLYRVRRGDLVIAMTDPPMISVAASPVCWIKGAFLINWLQDIFPEAAEALGFGTGFVSRCGLAVLRWFRTVTLRRATINVVLGQHMASRLRKLGVMERQIRIIPNWARGDLIQPVAAQHNVLRKEWGLDGVFVIGYSGNLGRAHETGTLLAAMMALEEAVAAANGPGATSSSSALPCQKTLPLPRLCWLFIGGGAELEVLKREVRQRNLTNVMFRPYQPRERLSLSLSLPDVHLVSLRPALEGLVVPSKYYGIAAAGRPAIFVGHPGGEIAQIVERSSAGFAIQEGDGPGLVRAIVALWEDPDLAARLGENARELFETEFDFALAAAKWESVIKQVALGRPTWKPDLEAAARRP
jgi:glycosyltransferase involved in cell wall biosynthesis